jgi:hypothetical protein
VEQRHKYITDTLQVNQEFLDTLETTILEYCKDNKLGNAYWYFSSLLSYKSKNALYEWFKGTETNRKIGYGELWTILKITQSESLLLTIITHLKQSINEEAK